MFWKKKRPYSEAKVGKDGNVHVDIYDANGHLIFESAPRGFKNYSEAERATKSLRDLR